MSNLLDSICWLPPASSLGGEVHVTCSSDVSEREFRPFPGRAFGLGTLDGQPVRETIGFIAVCVRGCFPLSVDVSDWPLRFPSALPVEFLEAPLAGGNGQVSMQRSRGKNEGYIYLGVLQRDGLVLPLLQIAKVLGLDEFWDTSSGLHSS